MSGTILVHAAMVARSHMPALSSVPRYAWGARPGPAQSSHPCGYTGESHHSRRIRALMAASVDCAGRPKEQWIVKRGVEPQPCRHRAPRLARCRPGSILLLRAPLTSQWAKCSGSACVCSGRSCRPVSLLREAPTASTQALRTPSAPVHRTASDLPTASLHVHYVAQDPARWPRRRPRPAANCDQSRDQQRARQPARSTNMALTCDDTEPTPGLEPGTTYLQGRARPSRTSCPVRTSCSKMFENVHRVTLGAGP